MPAKPVFISYAHGDEPTVVRLKKALKVNGISVWIDHENLEPGTPDWGNGIEYGLRQCQALIYVASPEAKNSRFVIHELEIANRWNIPIVPFWVAGAEWLDVAPFGWPRLEYIDARGEQADYGDAFSQLLKVLKKTDALMETTQLKETRKPSDSSHFETQPAVAIVPVINPLVVAPAPVEMTSQPEPISQAKPASQVEPSLQVKAPKRKGDGFMRFRPVAAILIAVVLLSGTSAVFLKSHQGPPVTGKATPTIVPTQRPPRWMVVGNTNIGSHVNVLYSVDAIASDDVWAAGYYRNSPSTTSKFTLIEHWDGSSWKPIDSPKGGAEINVLNGIEAVGSNDIWAVGDAGTKSLIEHWDGSAWVQKSSPNVGADQNYLNAVAARGANDVWAVGSSRNTPDDAARTLIEHWDGSSWRVTPSSSLGSDNNILYGVATLKQGDDVWAVGFHRNSPHSSALPLVEHWDGAAWQAIQAPSVGSGDNVLTGIAALAPDDIWAVGYSEKSSKDPARSLIEHWDGTSWTIKTSPNVGSGYNNLYSVTALNSNDVWAVGVGPLIVHWDGSSWQSVTSQGVDPTRNILNSISAVDADDIWAVGVFGGADQSSSNYTLIEHWTTS